MRGDDGFVFDSFYFVVKGGVVRFGSWLERWIQDFQMGCQPRNLLFWSFFPKTVDLWNWKKIGPRGGGCVSLVPLDPPLDYQFTKHLLVTAWDDVWTRVICCPGSVHVCPTALSVPQMANLKNTKSQSCTDQCYHIVDSFRGAVIIHVQLRPLCFRVVFRGINACFSGNVSKYINMKVTIFRICLIHIKPSVNSINIYILCLTPLVVSD